MIGEGELFDFLPCSDIPTYLQTMQRLREYSPRAAFPGHGRILDNAAYNEVIDEYLAAHGVLAARR